MVQIKNFTKKFPVVFAIIVLCITTPLTELHLEKYFVSFLDEQSASYLSGILQQGGVSILLFILIKWLGLLKEAGFTRISEWKQVWLVWPILVLSFLNIDERILDGSAVFDLSRPWLPVLFVLLYMSVGFIEEILLRGMVLPLMLRKWGKTKKGINFSVIFSSVIFGLLHLINLITGRRTLLSTTAQIIYGLFFGVFFAACFLRNRSIWPIIFTHALFDLMGNLNDIILGGDFGVVHELNLQGVMFSILFTIPLLFYGLFILRKVQPQDIPANQNIFPEYGE